MKLRSIAETTDAATLTLLNRDLNNTSPVQKQLEDQEKENEKLRKKEEQERKKEYIDIKNDINNVQRDVLTNIDTQTKTIKSSGDISNSLNTLNNKITSLR